MPTDDRMRQARVERDAAVLVVGNEILSGKTVDENGPFLARELRELGVVLRRIAVVPDEVPAIAAEVRAMAARHGHVFTCGGVGPTLDDVTVEGIAAAFGRPLYEDPLLAAVIRRHYGEATTASHLKMALVPEGAELRPLEGVPWPLLFVVNVMVLPGYPATLRRKFLAARSLFAARPFRLRRVFTTLEEGAIAPLLDAVHAAHPEVAIGSYPVYDDPEYTVQVTLESKDERPVEEALAALLGGIDPACVVRVE